MSWARRLKRVFGIEIEDCARCGGKLKVIASIEELEVIARILAHLEKTAPDQSQPELPLGARAPPSQARLPSEPRPANRCDGPRWAGGPCLGRSPVAERGIPV